MNPRHLVHAVAAAAFVALPVGALAAPDNNSNGNGNQCQ